MYPPPMPSPRPPRTGLPALAVVALCVLSLLGGCFGGAVIASTPSADTATASGPVRTKTVTAQPSTKTAASQPPAPKAAATPKPSKPAKVKMPKVVGSNGSVAMNKLEALGLTDITFGSADPDASIVLLPQNWKVTKQDPRAGAKVAPGTPVVLTAVKLAS